MLLASCLSFSQFAACGLSRINKLELEVCTNVGKGLSERSFHSFCRVY